MTRLEKELAAVEVMSAEQLRAQWSKLDPAAPPNVAIPLLRLLVAHRLQEKREGKLPALVRRELTRLAKSGEGSGAPAIRQKLSPGARLLREWNGQTLLVEVLETGFRFQDREWNSLSEIARHVTGTPRSGPRFFGLTANG
ncbi:DUF2924 domain-containing protein [Altererythrobacter sp. SALINAS58]|uniref:DUF2924 domain-containing protein n=1 Tax=Alteripontixanthobacter muriae TaxID=2705546 RepID=UPI001575F88A|nr:DUF2924 domain-containing protein [Alteripontixanthobacter muriae]